MRLRLLLAACASAWLPAQAPDAARMKADVDLLASPPFEGRLTATPGQAKAAQVVAERFRSLRLQAIGGGPDPYLLPYPLEHRAATEGGSTLALGAHRVVYGPGATSTRLAPIEADLVFVPENRKVKVPLGVWVARFAPERATPEAVETSVEEDLEAGAAGVVLLPRPGQDSLGVSRALERQFFQRGRYGFPPGEPAPLGLPEAAVDEASAAALGLDLPALQHRKEDLDLGHLQLAPDVRLETLHPVNVAGLLPGSDPALKDEWVVLSAHEDHLGLLGGKLHPGADDNASGTAVLLEVARLLRDAKPRRSILFLSVSGEELGLFGTEAFLADPPVPLKAIVADLNTDMVGRNDVRTLSVAPAHIDGATGTLTLEARRVAGDLGLTLTDEADAYWRRSDHYLFARAGIPALFLFGGMEPDYHQATDTPDKVEPEKLVHVAELLSRLALRVADAASRPEALPPAYWKSWIWSH